MYFQKKLTNLILISLVILGCVYTQRISIPLKIDQSSRLSLPLKYGTQQCEVNLIPKFNDCFNIISQTDQKVSECGDDFIGYNSLFLEQYAASLQLGNSQTTFQFTAPRTNQMFYGKNIICLGYLNIEGQKNALTGFFQAGQVTEERVYFNLYGSQNQQGFIGEIDIGAPNLSLIKKDAKLVQIQRSEDPSNPNSAIFQGKVSFFGQQLDKKSLVNLIYIQLDSPFHQFTSYAFQDILSIFGQNGIQYTYLEDQNYKVLLPSITKLKDLKINLIEKDNNTLFPITIKPSQYTRQLADGQYQLMIQPLFFTSSISLGYIIFETYYVGFDLPNQNILIAEKAEEQVHNFRGSSNISD